MCEDSETVSAPTLAAGSSIASATSVSTGTTYSGSITASNEKDFYKFTITSSGKIALTSTAVISAIKYELYDSTGECLWERGCYANNSGQCAVNETFELTKGTYYLGIVRYLDYVGNYSFKLTFTSAGESFTETGNGNNNEIRSADSISFGTTYKGQLAKNDEKDFYKFTLASSGKLTLTSAAVVSAIKYELYDSTGERLWERSCYANSSGQCAVNETFELTKGTYYLGIVRYLDYVGNYSFKLTFTSAGESFTETGNGNNNEIRSADSISIGTTYKGQLAINDKKDFYKFTPGSSGKLTLTSAANISAVTYYLYDDAGEQVWYSNYWANSSGQCTINEELELTKGTYYLGITMYTSGNVGNYSFKLTFTSAGEYFTETGNGNNNDMVSADSIMAGVGFRGQLALNDEKDFYKFTISSAGKYSLSSTAAMSAVDYGIYDSNGRCLWEKRAYANSGAASLSMDELIELSNGVYYLEIRRCSQSCTGNYWFKITPHTHSYTAEVTKATTWQNGRINYKCACGTEKETTIYYPKKVSLSSSTYTYDGKVKKPSVTVKGSNGKKINASNYTVKYASGRKNVGTYKVTIQFKGNYSGSISKTFKIKPKATSISKLTAKSKGFTVKWKKLTTQTSGYQIQYSTSKSFSGKTTKTITKNSTVSATYKGLKPKRKYYVRIRTYKKVSGTTYYSSWSAAKSVTTKK